MEFRSKSEWFEMKLPIGEPDNCIDYIGDSYWTERRVEVDGSTVWYGIDVNWKKEKDGEWTVLGRDSNIDPIEQGEGYVVYPQGSTIWIPCEEPIYERLYNKL